jgi:hypothetical protein
MSNFLMSDELLRCKDYEGRRFVFDSFDADGVADVYARYEGDAGATGFAPGV